MSCNDFGCRYEYRRISPLPRDAGRGTVRTTNLWGASSESNTPKVLKIIVLLDSGSDRRLDLKHLRLPEIGIEHYRLHDYLIAFPKNDITSF